MERRFLTVKEAKAAIPASHDKIYKLIKAGQLEVRKLGRRTLISVASIEHLHDSLPRAEIDRSNEAA
ncbi:helix-turn-helix domain-containing protein [Mesorhizobium sp. B1-1-6]|uniref:helix-turn-helix domain-containing protein n=1 Tax=Mesorhizobium sp. B1-1-6 TaxID=2589978 RepID=UPI00112E2FD7|nr:helix-turn-helix domain-containing protein [Mesorhizobium sp. B1-1-6]TPN41388.1 helix-turn-helix domain-containing protein [Mesorhizobium sp. B1-1-6]